MEPWLKDCHDNFDDLEDWLKDAVLKLKNMPEKALKVREAALADLCFFAKLMNPGYVYGSVHMEVFRWMQDYSLYTGEDSQTQNKLIMLPRAHLKSHMVMTYVCWLIARHPEITILYVSATAELAITQLGAIQNLISGGPFMKYFPEYINPQKGSREKWAQNKIIVDHPKRKKEGIRDATVVIAGLTTNTTGWHADVVCADDLVVPENAYTEDGREAVSKKSSQFTSIRNAGGFTIAAGTRYHPADIYDTWKKQQVENYDENDEYVGKAPVWDIKEYQVEVEDVFLWPRTVRSDGKAFGFNIRTLSRIRAEYDDQVQFYAQYYNDPNDPGSERVDRSNFQYFNPKMVENIQGAWFYKGNKLNIYAAVDFAYSLSKSADYTAIVVVGVDSNKNYYVLDIERFKSNKTQDYYKKVKTLHSKWYFKKINAEVTAAQSVIVEGIKDYVKKDGLRLSVKEYRPSKAEGGKNRGLVLF